MLVSNELKQSFLNESGKLEFKITINGVVYDNSSITSNGITFKESLFSTEILDYSCVEKGECSFELINFKQDVKAMIGQRFSIEMRYDNSLVVTQYFTIYDISKKNDDLVIIKAYDDLVYFDKDVTDWYNSLPTNTQITTREIFIGLLKAVGLPTNGMIDMNPYTNCKISTRQDNIKGYEVLGWIQERVRAFYKFGKGSLDMYKVKFGDEETSTPSLIYTPSMIKTVYMSDYKTKKITKAQIKTTKKDVGGIHGTGTNAYVIEGNPLYGGMDSSELSNEATSLYRDVENISYQPFRGTFIGLPYVEVGDLIEIQTKHNVARTRVVKRVLKCRGLITDEIECQSKEKRTEVKLVNKHLEILRQKTLEIEATVDKFETKITNIETENGQIKKEMSAITQTSNQIKTDVQTVKSDLSKAQSSITQNSENIKLEVAKTSVNNYFKNLCIDNTTYVLNPVTQFNGKNFNILSLGWNNEMSSYSVTINAVQLANYIDERRNSNTSNSAHITSYSKVASKTNFYKYFSNFKHTTQFFCEERSYNYEQWLSCNNNVSFINGYISVIWRLQNGQNYAIVNSLKEPPKARESNNIVYKTDFTLPSPASYFTSPSFGFELHDYQNVDTNKLRTMSNLTISFEKLCLLIDEPDQKAGFYTSTVNQSVISEINMSPDAVKIKAERIDLQGYVTVSDLSGQNKTTIDGSNIKTGTINAMTINAPRLQNVSTINGVSVNQGKNDITVANWDGRLVRLHYNNGIITNWQITNDEADGCIPALCVVYRRSDGLLMLGAQSRVSNGQTFTAPNGQFYRITYRSNGMILATDVLENGYPYKV